MSKLPYKVIVPMAAVAIIGAGFYGISQASAAGDGSDSTQRSSLIQKLADTFHLDKSKVQAVFDENRKDNEADRETQYEARLTQAVTDGKLTADQKTKVLAEHKKLAAEMDAARQNAESSSTTRDANRTAMEKIRNESEDWAKSNNIDAKWLMGGMGGGIMGHGGFGGRHMERSGSSTSSPSPSPSTNSSSN